LMSTCLTLSRPIIISFSNGCLFFRLRNGCLFFRLRNGCLYVRKR
jgi:hypothetical protein